MPHGGSALICDLTSFPMLACHASSFFLECVADLCLMCQGPSVWFCGKLCVVQRRGPVNPLAWLHLEHVASPLPQFSPLARQGRKLLGGFPRGNRCDSLARRGVTVLFLPSGHIPAGDLPGLCRCPSPLAVPTFFRNQNHHTPDCL